VEWHERHARCATSTPGPGLRSPYGWSGGSVIVLVSAAAASGSASTSAAMPRVRRMPRLLARLDGDALDDVAQIAGRVPHGLVPLRLADRVEGPDHQPMFARPRRRPHRTPFAERVTAEVRPELRAPPGDALVVGHLDLADAVAAVERDALERHGPPGDDARAAGGCTGGRGGPHAGD